MRISTPTHGLHGASRLPTRRVGRGPWGGLDLAAGPGRHTLLFTPGVDASPRGYIDTKPPEVPSPPEWVRVRACVLFCFPQRVKYQQSLLPLSFALSILPAVFTLWLRPGGCHRTPQRRGVSPFRGTVVGGGEGELRLPSLTEGCPFCKWSQAAVSLVAHVIKISLEKKVLKPFYDKVFLYCWELFLAYSDALGRLAGTSEY